MQIDSNNITVKFTIPAPENMNEERVRKGFERNIAQAAGGFTRTDAYGGWVNDKMELILDDNHLYQVSVMTEGVSEDEAHRKVMRVLMYVTQWAAYLAQDATFIEITVDGESSIFMRDPDELAEEVLLKLLSEDGEEDE